MRCRVFYSWESDLPSTTNRDLIEAALRTAASSVRADQSIDVEPVIDRDTYGVPGAPDVANTVFTKIEQAHVFVCDISITGRSPRPAPNPNVLFELGYAIRALGPQRILLVMNTAFGIPEELPFDIRMRRAIRYQVSDEEGDHGAEIQRLEADVEQGLRAILADIDAALPVTPMHNPKAVEILSYKGTTVTVVTVGHKLGRVDVVGHGNTVLEYVCRVEDCNDHFVRLFDIGTDETHSESLDHVQITRDEKRYRPKLTFR